MELEASGVQRSCRSSLNMAPVNKVHHVRTIALVAKMLGEDKDWLCDVANEMDQEDGLIWVYGPGDDGVMHSQMTASRTSRTLSRSTRMIRASSLNRDGFSTPFGSQPTASEPPLSYINTRGPRRMATAFPAEHVEIADMWVAVQRDCSSHGACPSRPSPARREHQMAGQSSAQHAHHPSQRHQADIVPNRDRCPVG